MQKPGPLSAGESIKGLPLLIWSVRRTEEGGRGPHENAPKIRFFDAQVISLTKVKLIHEGMALLLLIAAAGADGSEKRITGASCGH